jgi:L-amino acid N-acyltransferase
MTGVMVRDAGEDDVPAILAIANEVVATSAAIWRDDPETLDERLAWFRRRTAAGYPVLVATDASGVGGFASYGPFRSAPGYAPTVEHTVHVRADRRGTGTGRALLEALMERATQRGLQVMVGAIDGGNEVSLAFHRRLGFVEVGRMPGVGRKFGRPVDLVLMQRTLRSGMALPSGPA